MMRERLGELAARHGLELIGVTDAGPLPDARARMEESVAAGRMARMDWMGAIVRALRPIRGHRIQPRGR